MDMEKFLLILSILSASILCKFNDQDVTRMWMRHKQKYQLEFEVVEDQNRMRIFRDNLFYIEEFNKQAESYKLKMNHFGSWTHQEYVEWITGMKPNVQGLSNNETVFHMLDDGDYENETEENEEDIDWRMHGVITTVKNQKKCLSSWAFASVGAVEAFYAMKSFTLVDLSEQELIDCSSGLGNSGCQGGDPIYAYRYIISNGISTHYDYPYSGRTGRCYAAQTDRVTRFTQINYLSPGNEDVIGKVVKKIGPVSVVVDATPRTFMFYNSGVYNDVNCSSTNVNHAMLVIGVISSQNPHFILKNSFGQSWGEDGYLSLEKNGTNRCGVAASATFPIM